MDLPGRERILIPFFLAVSLAAGGVAFGQTPTLLTVEGIANNRHVLSHTPEFCWTFVGNQTNWQIQVDDDPNFTLNLQHTPPQVWFWDSGQQDKAANNDDRCATLRSINLPGFTPISVDRRAGGIYWRLRLKVGSSWGPWVTSGLRMNQYPMPAENVSVQGDPAPSNDPVLTVPARITGRTLYVSPTGNDNNPGTQAQPWKTIGFAARQLDKGDTLLVRGGNYDENTLISGANGYRSGQLNNPITVRAFTGETPVLRAVASGSRTALMIEGPGGNVTDWVFDGLRFGGASTTIGMMISGAKNITVKSCSFHSTMTTSAIGILVANSSEDVRITNCLIDKPLFDQIEIGAARHVEIRNNEFTNFNSRHGIHAHGGSANNMVIADNYFHDGHPFEGAIFLYLGTQGSRVVNNVFANILRADPGNPSNTGLGNALLVVRSGEITVENNVFYNTEHAAIQLNEFSNFGIYRNNIFMDCETGIRFRGGVASFSSTAGAVMDYNIFYNNTTDVSIPTGEPLDHPATGNCMGGSGCDPRFVNAAAGNFQLNANSPAIDAGDPLSPVPVGGGSRADIGRFERGAATPPYQFEPQLSVSDSTPRFTWDLVDVDNKLEQLFDDLPPGDVDFQTRYQVQVDSAPSFDSLSPGRPLLDSGIVSSLSEDYTIPNGSPLTSGTYYMRVRQWDDQDSVNKGAWSDHNFAFRLVAGPAPPYLTGLIPAAGATNVVESTLVVAQLRDDDVGVDPASIHMYVNGVEVTPVRTGTPSNFTLTYTPLVPFVLESTVTVRITAEDENATPPGLDSTWTFRIRDITPPAPPSNVRITP